MPGVVIPGRPDSSSDVARGTRNLRRRGESGAAFDSFGRAETKTPGAKRAPAWPQREHPESPVPVSGVQPKVGADAKGFVPALGPT